MKFKLIKKAAAALMCAAVICAGVVTAFAEGKAYSIHEAADMQITLPDDMTAVTRSSGANDKYFSLFGIDYTTNKEKFESSNIYLQGMNSSSSLTVTVTMTETQDSQNMGNYNLLESDKLSEVARNFLSQSEYTSCTVDQVQSSIIWLEFNAKVSNGGSTIEAYQANTVYDGKSVNVTLQRNGGNVTEDDYQVFNSIISSVEFNKPGWFSPLMPYFLIGGAVLLILIIVFIIIIVRVAKRRRKKSNNEKILEELAGKYTSNRQTRAYSQNSEPETTARYSPEAEDVKEEIHSDRDLSFSDGADEVRQYSDEEIDAMLGEGGEKPNFIQALPESEEEPEEVRDDTIDNSDHVSEFFEDHPAPELPVKNDAAAVPTTKKFDFPQKAKKKLAGVLGIIEAKPSEKPEQETEQETVEKPDEPVVIEPISLEPKNEDDGFIPTEQFEDGGELQIEEIEKAELDEEPQENEAGQTEESAHPAKPEAQDGQPEQTETVDDDGTREYKGELDESLKSAIEEFDTDDNGEEDYNNDEVLVREEAKRTKFRDSSDYFEEAPKKVMGVISSKEIQDAEEYDVIGEVERRASEVEREPAPKGEKVSEAFKKAGGSVKSFFTHCGYFVTNVKREVKRKKAAKKRQQYEEDRKRRARERAERQRQQAQNGGLVQVHKRTDRKPSSQQRRPVSQQRRSNTQTRRPSAQNRRGNPPRKR